MVVVAKTLDSQELVAALKGAGFGGSITEVRGINAEDEAASAPPLPGLSVDEREPTAGKTTYSSPAFAKHVQVRAYWDHGVLNPGDSFRIAVVFEIENGWHIYGNPLGPGVGKATVVSARVVSEKGAGGFQFEPARYAAGHRTPQNFGEGENTWVWEHTGKIVHFLSGKVSDAAQPGEYLLSVDASAQVCAEATCLPGKATIPLAVTIVAGGVPSYHANDEFFNSFDQARKP